MIRPVRVLFMAWAACALASVPAAAQQRTPPKDTVKTPRQTVIDKLKSIEERARLDSLRLAGDTSAAVRRDTARTQERQAPPEIGTDSIMDALMRIAGYSAITYKGQAARFSADSSVLVLRATAEQKAVVVREGQTMSADSLLRFNQNTNVACAYGKPVLSGQGANAPVVSQQLCYNSNSQIGFALDATTTVSEGANWKVHAARLMTRGTNVYGHNGVFTDCNLEIPHYHFSAGSVKVVNDKVMVARDVTLNFGDVPVFWLPFLMQSMEQGRRSGILMPRFSVNDIVRRNSRYDRKIEDVGLYWAINDHLGAEMAMDWFSNNWTALRGSFDYKWLDKFLDGRFTYKQFWKTEGGGEFSLATGNSWEPNERTNIRIDANYITSSSFVSQRSYDPRELTRSIDSNAGINRRFDWGSVSFGASRKQYLSDNKVDLTLPSLGVNLASITFLEAVGEPKWYNNATWTGSAQTRVSATAIDETLENIGQRDRREVSATASSSFNVGSFSWSQSFDLRDQTDMERLSLGTDTALARVNTQNIGWNTSINYQQRLIGTTTFTPGVTMRGQMARSPQSEGELVSAPARIDVNAALKADIYGFWPGIGPIERIRHRLSPTFTYSYSPELKGTALQDSVFGATQSLEQNRISIGLSQTIEGKYREDEKTKNDSTKAPVDTASTDPSQPKRLPQPRKVQILSLSTDAVLYDFVAAREGGQGIQTLEISNSIQSDLLRGLQLSITHDLFRREGTGPSVPSTLPGVPVSTQGRTFAPHLSRVSTSFSLTGSSWIFQALGLSGESEAPPATGSTESPVPGQADAGPAIDRSREEFGMIGTRRREPEVRSTGPVGSWNASLNYTLFRPRDDVAEASTQENQMVTANLTFKPTQNWSVSWNTGYSFSEAAFTDHILTLTRELHDWDANFDFVKAQNGNFSFQFRVALRANPDLKFDYEQRDNARRLQ